MNDSSAPDVAETLTIVSVSDGSAGGAITFLGGNTIGSVPSPDFFGTETFTYTINDGTLGSIDAAMVTVTVTPVNDPPTFTRGSDQSVRNTAGARTVAGWAADISPGPVNESGQSLTFWVSSDKTSLFLVQPAVDPSTGDLTYTPARDASGSAKVDVRLMDDGETANGGVDESPLRTFNINIRRVTKPPSVVNKPPTAIDDAKETKEDGPLSFAASDLVINDSPGPANEAGQTLTVTSVSQTSDEGGTASLVDGGELHSTPRLLRPRLLHVPGGRRWHHRGPL